MTAQIVSAQSFAFWLLFALWFLNAVFSCSMLFGFAFCDLVPYLRVEFRVIGGKRFQAMWVPPFFFPPPIYKWVKVLKEDLISICGGSWY